MSKKDDQPSMFKSLLDKAKTRAEEPEVELTASPTVEPIEQLDLKQENLSKPRQAGRPKGRRSNPDYTQISAYVPLELYLDVQTELLKERKLKRQRSAIDVSTLVEQLLRDWMKSRPSE